MTKVKVATVWLDGCSGCHMSVLDMDERLVELAQKIDVVFSPLVDHKVFPDDVDIAIVEGAVSTDDQNHSGALQNADRLGRLCDHGQCAIHAQSLFGYVCFRTRLYGKRHNAMANPQRYYPASS